jgi:hypothetical protein
MATLGAVPLALYSGTFQTLASAPWLSKVQSAPGTTCTVDDAITSNKVAVLQDNGICTPKDDDFDNAGKFAILSANENGAVLLLHR